MHMDENFFANSMEALRPVTQVLGFLSLLPPINDSVEQLASSAGFRWCGGFCEGYG